MSARFFVKLTNSCSSCGIGFLLMVLGSKQDRAGRASAMTRSDSGWICLGKIDFVARPAFQRLERRRVVDVQHVVELVGQPRAEVMTQAFGLGTIDDANRALQPRILQCLP